MTEECNTSVQPYAKPFFAVMPVLWRLFQCLRRYKDSRVKDHLYNAGKYTATLSVTFFSTITSSNSRSPFFYCWLVSVIVNTVYCYYSVNELQVYQVIKIRSSDNKMKKY